jgi:hypothetical protein
MGMLLFNARAIFIRFMSLKPFKGAYGSLLMMRVRIEKTAPFHVGDPYNFTVI